MGISGRFYLDNASCTAAELAELALLGLILIQPGHLRAAFALRPAEMPTKNGEKTLAAMRGLAAAGDEINCESVGFRLEGMNAEYPFTFLGRCLDAAGVDERDARVYVKVLKEDAISRRMRRL